MRHIRDAPELAHNLARAVSKDRAEHRGHRSTLFWFVRAGYDVPTDPNHCLHHGAWRNSIGPYTGILRTQLIRRGTKIRQTVTFGALFGAAFEANARGIKTFSENNRAVSVTVDGRQVSQPYKVSRKRARAEGKQNPAPKPMLLGSNPGHHQRGEFRSSLEQTR